MEDRLRKHSPKTVDFLKQNNIEVILLTGDNAFTAGKIAGESGIKNFKAGQLPQDKLEYISALQKEGKKVMMIGDGINDAPALVKADIGVSVSNASDISREYSDISIINGDIDSITSIFKISKEGVKTLKNNLWWAFSYNIIGIPMASLGLLKPVIAAIAMSLSSILIINNSQKLRDRF